ncbi:MAG: epoxyqueuosine reductase QueH [Candidatus Brocadiia bacterium]|nr:epoxyqueuosine reductase QueH [Candidatus Brocadiia bacterium]
MKVLLHTCCGACTIGPLEDLRGEGHEVTGYFYNPNIHPLLEFRRRLKAQKLLAERVKLAMSCEEDYGLREFLDRVDWRGPGRCADCYRLRLERAAAVAGERGFEAVTTTLLASAHQDHELVRSVGEGCAAAGARFLYRDWRPLAQECPEQARRMGLYLQQYCGCMFSEFERFQDTRLHLYRGGSR